MFDRIVSKQVNDTPSPERSDANYLVSHGSEPDDSRIVPNIPYIELLKQLAELDPNYALENRAEFTEANGWHIDSYEADLPPEPPGPPIEGGSFSIAKKILHDYTFVDPDLVEGHFNPNEGLLGRVMLLKVRVYFLRFEFGVRVSKVVDELVDGQYIWGYSYHTLRGHFEMGEITFLVAKVRDDGKVFFRINAYSKLARIGNPILRIGARLFGRRLQIRFARNALSRVQELVAGRLGQQDVVS